jgi:hypothetical protein
MIDHDNLIEKLREIHPPETDGSIEFITMSFIGAITALAAALFISKKTHKKQNIYDQSLKKIARYPNQDKANRIAFHARVLRDIAASKNPEFALLRGEQWLSQLDIIFKTSYFTLGPGRVYGEDIYKLSSIESIDMLDRELCNLLSRLKNARD